MRAYMTPRGTWFSACLFAAGMAVACTDAPTDVTRISLETGNARSLSASYTSSSLGALPGDNSSRANGVNDAGEVVGYSCCSAGNRAFVRVSSGLTALSGANANALAISNGTPRYVVGWAGSPSLPVRWTVTAGAASEPTYLSLGTATYGAARGVNDLGQSVGNAGDDAAMWDADGNLTLVPAPAGFARGEGRGIDNAGHAVFVFSRSDPSWPDGVAIGYLRLATGELVMLPPNTATGISYANALTPVNGSTVRIAGSTYADPSSSRAVRWTVDILQQQIVATETRSETSHAVAISDAGAVAGFVEGPTNSLKSNAFRWQGSEMLTLNPPKTGKEGKAWAMSPSGTFVAGDAMLQTGRMAILWRISP
jgi:hypothetical protein